MGGKGAPLYLPFPPFGGARPARDYLPLPQGAVPKEAPSVATAGGRGHPA